MNNSHASHSEARPRKPVHVTRDVRGLLTVDEAFEAARSLRPRSFGRGNTRLRPTQRRDIVRRLASGENASAIASRYAVSAHRVRQIGREATEGHLNVVTVCDLRRNLVEDIAAGHIDVPHANDLLVVVAASAADFRARLAQQGGAA